MNLASFRDFLVLFELCTFLKKEMFESQETVTQLQQPMPLRPNLLLKPKLSISSLLASKPLGQPGSIPPSLRHSGHKLIELRQVCYVASAP